MSVWDDLELKIRAGYPYLYLITHEEGRTVAHLRMLAKRLKRPLHVYSAYSNFDPELPMVSDDPLKTAASGPEGLFVLRDFHMRLSEAAIIRQLKDMRDAFIKQKQTLLITAPVLALPVELEKQVNVVDIPLPDIRELTVIFKGLCEQRKLECKDKQAEAFGRSASGLTAEEATLIFSRMHLEPDRIAKGDTAPVIEEKRRLIQEDGVLHFYDRSVTLNDVGGLHALKGWLAQRSSAFDARAREFGLPEPKGLMLLGVQGCGKSLSAKAIASHWKLPLVQLDLVAAFSGSRSPEETIRRSLKLLEAMSPVVVWIDEIEKGFAGTGGEAEMSTQRVFGYFITWLQEKQKPVFVVATANRVDALPPELLRKGRFDELFFVDLPDEKERTEILALHMASRHVDKKVADMGALVSATRNFSGAELEQVVVDGLYRAYADDRKPTAEDFSITASQLIPIYTTYEEAIKHLRDWCKNRTRQASHDTTLLDYFEREEED